MTDEAERIQEAQRNDAPSPPSAAVDVAQRIAIAALFASGAVSTLAAICCCYWDRVVYPTARHSLDDAVRLVWMIPFSFAGLAWRAWSWRSYGAKLIDGQREPGRFEPFFSYFLTYPFLLALGNVLAFGAMHSFLRLDNWLYYLVSPIFALALAIAPGRWRDFLRFGGLTEPRHRP